MENSRVFMNTGIPRFWYSLQSPRDKNNIFYNIYPLFISILIKRGSNFISIQNQVLKI